MSDDDDLYPWAAPDAGANAVTDAGANAVTDADANAGPPPLETAHQPWVLTTWWGASLVAIGAFLFYLVGAQLVPGLGIGIAHSIVAPDEPIDLGVLITVITWWATTFSVGVIVTLRLLRCLPRRRALSPRLWKRLAWLGGALLACYFGQETISRLLSELGVPVQEQPLLVEAVKKGGIAVFLALVVAAPIGEELFFRGVLFDLLSGGTGRIAAYVITALLFAVVHLNPTAFVLYAWMAFWFAFAYERTGTVWGAIALHMANNLLALLHVLGS